MSFCTEVGAELPVTQNVAWLRNEIARLNERILGLKIELRFALKDKDVYRASLREAREDIVKIQTMLRGSSR